MPTKRAVKQQLMIWFSLVCWQSQPGVARLFSIVGFLSHFCLSRRLFRRRLAADSFLCVPPPLSLTFYPAGLCSVKNCSNTGRAVFEVQCTWAQDVDLLWLSITLFSLCFFLPHTSVPDMKEAKLLDLHLCCILSLRAFLLLIKKQKNIFSLDY